MKFQKSEKNWLEWTVFSISLLLVFAVLGSLLRQSLNNQNHPPDLVLTLGQPETSTQGFIVPLTLTNRGDQTAQGVGVEVRAAAPLNQSSQLQFDFVARGEKRKGWAAFSGTAKDIGLTARVTGYHVE